LVLKIEHGAFFIDNFLKSATRRDQEILLITPGNDPCFVFANLAEDFLA
jgi:hypothetical protein